MQRRRNVRPTTTQSPQDGVDGFFWRFFCNRYVPWNLHEARRGVFDFGDGGGDMSPLLDLRRFVELARQADLFVILRPGPYICAEWEFGGLPR